MHHLAREVILRSGNGLFEKGVIEVGMKKCGTASKLNRNGSWPINKEKRKKKQEKRMSKV